MVVSVKEIKNKVYKSLEIFVIFNRMVIKGFCENVILRNSL